MVCASAGREEGEVAASGTTRIGRRRGARMAPLLVVGVLLLAVVSFHALGAGPLASPPLSPAGWPGWVATRDPLLATVAILRLVVLLLTWYLLAATVIGGLVRVLRAARLVRLADALTVPTVRRLLQGAFGLTVATAVATSVPAGAAHAWSGAGAGVAPSAGVATVPFDGSLDGTSVLTLPGGNRVSPPAHAVDHPVLRPRPADGRLRLRWSDGPGERRPGDGPAAPSSGPVPAPDDQRGHTPVHEVVPGESFWSIAADRVGAVSAHAPTDGQITTYWRRLIAANADRLAVPEDPDLIFPGQRFVLPEVLLHGTPDGDGGAS